MTRDEALAGINKTTRTCRGPLREGIRKQIAELFSQGKYGEATALDTPNRSYCGYNFNQTIIDGPWDGEIHSYKCPQCGVQGEYRAPSFELDG